MVQHRAAYFITNNYSHQAGVTEMLKKLDLPSLSQRRDNLKLVTFHKVVNKQIQMPNNELRFCIPQPKATITTMKELKLELTVTYSPSSLP